VSLKFLPSGVSIFSLIATQESERRKENGEKCFDNKFSYQERARGQRFTLLPFFLISLFGCFCFSIILKNTAHTHCGMIDLTCRLDGRLTTLATVKVFGKKSLEPKSANQLRRYSKFLPIANLGNEEKKI
jgi:hypothetical protein